MIELKQGNTDNSFNNNGEMLECKLINDKFNYYSEGNKIDFHLINTNEKMYINLGDNVTTEEINEILNR